MSYQFLYLNKQNKYPCIEMVLIVYGEALVFLVYPELVHIKVGVQITAIMNFELNIAHQGGFMDQHIIIF